MQFPLKILASAVVATGLLMSPSGANAQCASYTVHAWGDYKRTWSFARASAVVSWRRTVRSRLGHRWNTWARARNRILSCTERGRRKRCWARARPCRR